MQSLNCFNYIPVLSRHQARGCTTDSATWNAFMFADSSAGLRRTVLPDLARQFCPAVLDSSARSN